MVSASSLRAPGEFFDLFIGFIIVSFVVLLLAIVTFGIACCYIIFGFGMAAVVTWMANKGMPESSRVGPQNFSRLNTVSSYAMAQLGVDSVPIYVSGERVVNAYARGIFGPVIVLNKGLLDILEDDEVAFTVGHERGHIMLKHTALKTALESGMTQMPWYLYPIVWLFRLVFLRGRMSRSMETSADRAGLWACQDIEASVRCLLKLKDGNPYVNEDTLRMALSGTLPEADAPGIGDDLQRLISTHPETTRRVNALVKYSRDTGVGWKWAR